jgi:tRNA dimethylallyltransferase
VRAALEARLACEGIAPLYEELCRLDPAYAATVHPNNHGRVLRALELYRQTGLTMTQQRLRSRPAQRPFDDCIVGLGWPREVLYARIEKRVDAMMQQGLLEEARLVCQQRERYYTAAQAIGYKEFFAYFDGEASLEACVDKLKQATRNYAKRQITWFKRMPTLQWQPADAPDAAQAIENLWQGEKGEQR